MQRQHVQSLKDALYHMQMRRKEYEKNRSYKLSLRKIFVVIIVLLTLIYPFRDITAMYFKMNIITNQQMNRMNTTQTNSTGTTNYTIETNNINNTNTILNRPKYKDYDMIILQWTTIWGINTNISLTTICNISGTDKINQKILITDDNSLRPFAKALIFHGPDIKTIETIKRTHKKHDDIYIFQMRESPGCHPLIWQQKFLSHFNLEMSYKLNSDIPIPYLSLNSFKPFIFENNIHSFAEKDATTADVLWIGRNCRAANGREKYLAELFKYIPSHSLGPCLYLNPSNVKIPPRSNYLFDISNIVSNYKFYMAIENSNCEGYITEKLSKSLEATTIPIVFSVNGIPEYHKILPVHSYINAANFDSAKDLAQYLKMVASNETLYNSFFDFKSTERKRQNEWNRLINIFGAIGHNTTWCRTANIIYNIHKNKQYDKVVAIDDSCIERNIMAKYAN
eukprot:433226_1